MGKGDKRTKRGKINNGSFGKTRRHKVKKKSAPRKGTTAAGAKRAAKK